MLGRLMLMLSVAFITTGFVSRSDNMREQLDILPQHYANFDVKMAWDVKAIGGNTVVDGVIQNVRYAMMEDVEIWVALLDDRGKTVRRGVAYVSPLRLDLDEATAFSVKVPTVVPHGAKLLFTYKYDGLDGGGFDMPGGGTKWMQSFEAKVP